MKIELVSFPFNLNETIKLSLISQIINSSEADLILFPGNTIGFISDLMRLREKITNKKTEAFLEITDFNSDFLRNNLVRLKSGEMKNLFTHQLFAESSEIEHNEFLCESLINEILTKRTFKIKNKKIILFQCGELNILRNLQNQKNKVEFRLFDNKILKGQFLKIIEGADIILNPIHTPMGNQGKMSKRRVFLSSSNRFYFSSSNSSPKFKNILSKGLQYAYCNGKAISSIYMEYTKKFVRRTYEIN